MDLLPWTQTSPSAQYDPGYFDRLDDELRYVPRRRGRRRKDLVMAVTGIVGCMVFLSVAILVGGSVGSATCASCAGSIAQQGTAQWKESNRKGGRWMIRPEGKCGDGRLVRVTHESGDGAGNWGAVDASGRFWPLGRLQPGGSVVIRLPAGVDPASLKVGAL